MKRHRKYKEMQWQGWYICRSKKVIFGVRVARNKIDFSNYIKFPIGMPWKEAKVKMDKKGITYEHRPKDEPPF